MTLNEIRDEHLSNHASVSQTMAALEERITKSIGWYAVLHTYKDDPRLSLWKKTDNTPSVILNLRITNKSPLTCEVEQDGGYKEDGDKLLPDFKKWINEGGNLDLLYKVFLEEKRLNLGHCLFSHKTSEPELKWELFLRLSAPNVTSHKIIAVSEDRDPDSTYVISFSVKGIDVELTDASDLNIPHCEQELTQALTDYLKTLEQDS